MKRIVLIIGAVLLLVVIAVLAIPFLIPASQYKASIERAASDATGRAVKVNGPLKFTLWPVLGLTAQAVSIANAPGGASPTLATIGELDVGVAVLPLLRGDIEVKKLVVRKAVLTLEENAGGKPNWVFQAAGKTETGAAKLRQLGFSNVRVEDGLLSYRDRAGKITAIGALNAAAALESLDSPLRIAGDFVYGGDKADFALAFARPRAFTESGETPLTASLKAPKLTFDLNGALDAKSMALSGKLAAKGASLRQAAAWSGNPIGEGGGLGPFSVAGDLRMEGPRIALSNAAFTLDAARGRGDIAILTAEQKPPYVSGALALEALDVNAYLSSPKAQAANAAKGVDVNAPWGAAPIDLSGMRAINADLKLTTGRLTFQKMKIDRAAMDIDLNDGVMKAKLNQLALYGGSGAGELTLDGRGAGVRLSNRLSAKGVNAAPFLADAVGFNKIEGRANVDVAIAGAGTTQQAVMNTLSGAATFNIENGDFKGVDLEQIAKQVLSVLSPTALGPNAKTQFSEMAASFKIANGVAHTDDGRVTNPVLRITGTGDIDLGRQTMNMKVTPKYVKASQSANADAKGIAVPFAVKGPWAKLSFTPDVSGAVQEQLKKQIDKALSGKDLSSILTGSKGAQEGEGSGAQKPTAIDLLQGLIKKKTAPASAAPAP
jgi:AsmA protein